MYPARTRRNRRVRELRQGEPAVLGGRLRKDGDRWLLADGSGEVEVSAAGIDPAWDGALVEADGVAGPARFDAREWVRVAPCLGPSPDPSLDLAALVARDRLLGTVRRWMRENGFLEVETPTLLRASGLNPHIAELRSEYRERPGSGRVPLWLRTSPEVFHKRLLSKGVERFYELGRFYRNGEAGPLHNPEFTGLEFYIAWSDYRAIMEATERLLSDAFVAARGAVDGAAPAAEPTITVEGAVVDLSPPWERMTVGDAFRRHAGVDLAAASDLPRLRRAAEGIGVRVADSDAYDDVFFRILLERVEARLGATRPLFLHDYPASMAVMARRRDDDPSIAERVELYVRGVELANGFTELADPAEQRRRFEEDRTAYARHVGAESADLPFDESFLGALVHGMPPSSGIAIGLDRVLMLALGRTTLRGVLAFPFDPPDR